MIKYCDGCRKKGKLIIATEQHHKFSQTKLYKKLYGEYIHHPDNIQYLCYDCHHNKPLDKWDEIQFCKHFEIYPRSKSGIEKAKKLQKSNKNA